MDFKYSGKIEKFRVDKSGLYVIECWGAKGGGRYPEKTGHGAYSRSIVYIKEGDTVSLLVGGSGVWKDTVGSGGGGSFVQLDTTTTLLCAAGGGGGSQQNFNHDKTSEYFITNFSHGQSCKSGGSYLGNGNNTAVDGNAGSDCGTYTNTAQIQGTSYIGGGAGYKNDACSKNESHGFGHQLYMGAKSFLNGGNGGYGIGHLNVIAGGFGGGGGGLVSSIDYACYERYYTYTLPQGAGGGGGYCGGDNARCDIECGAGGGGSYFIGPNSFAKAGYEKMPKPLTYNEFVIGNYDDGAVRIELTSNYYILKNDDKFFIPRKKNFNVVANRFMPVSYEFITDIKNINDFPKSIPELNKRFIIEGKEYLPSDYIDFKNCNIVYFSDINIYSHADLKYTPSEKALLNGNFRVKENFNIKSRQLENCSFNYTGNDVKTLLESFNKDEDFLTKYIGIGYKESDLKNISKDGITASDIKNYRIDFDTHLEIVPTSPNSVLKNITLYGKNNSVYRKMNDNEIQIYNDFDNIYIKFKNEHSEIIINKIKRTSQQEMINSLSKIIRFPVKINDYDKVPGYSASLTHGEEQLLITRDCKFYLTDGKGGYLEFKTINSGITLNEVTIKINELNTKLSGDVATLESTITCLRLEFDKYVTNVDFKTLSEKVEVLSKDTNDINVKINKMETNIGNTINDANHINRNTLNKFSEDTSGNPLFDGKKIVADFDTSKIEAEIANLNNRSVIGKQLDYGLFTRSTDFIISSLADEITFDKVNDTNMQLSSRGRPILKAGKKYIIKFSVRTTGLTGGLDFGLYDYTNKKQINSVTIDRYSTNSIYIINPSVAYYCPTTDCEINMNMTYYNSTTNVTLPADSCYMEIQESNRTTIIDPAEDAKKIQFEYGLFTNLNAQNISDAYLLKVNHLKSGNMTISANGYIYLKAGKTYKIRSMVGSNKTNVDFMIYDVTKAIEIGIHGGNAQYSPSQSMAIAEYTPTVDCEITVKTKNCDASSVISGWQFYIDVEEIAQPYYFNYYKDSVSSTVLFDGNGDTTGSKYNLLDDIANYNQLLIYASLSDGSVTSMTVDASSLKQSYSIGCFLNTDYYYNIRFNFSGKTFDIIDKWVSNNWSNYNFKIFKIVGIGYNYENPYQDIVTSIENFTITDMEADAAIKDIWNEVSI